MVVKRERRTRRQLLQSYRERKRKVGLKSELIEIRLTATAQRNYNLLYSPGYDSKSRCVFRFEKM